MALQKFRADKEGDTCLNGARPFYAEWMGGPSLAKILNCPVDIEGAAPRAVYITGEADTWFSIPAAISWKGKRLTGFVTSDETGLRFCAHSAALEKFGLTRRAESD